MTTAPTKKQVRRLRSHFAIEKMPFSKCMWAAHMFDSLAQRELLQALQMWTEVKGICLVTGPTGVGKSITVRRFVQELDQSRFRIIDFSYLPSTVAGFLRSLTRKLCLPMRAYSSDLFDAAQAHLAAYEKEHGAHPLIVLDDAEGLRVSVVDAIRRLTSYDLDSEDRFSVLMSGTDELLATLADSTLAPLRSRFSYSCALRAFNLEDTTNYIAFHLSRAGVDPKLFTDAAVKKLFQTSMGRPRNVNQLGIQALIQAAVQGRDSIDGDFMAHLITAHPLYQPTQGTRS
jgi:type II secretory pathway predicted ATPase ExeA